MVYRHAIDATTYVFNDLRDLLAKATPPRSGDRLAGIAADSAAQMIAARIALADVPLKQFLHETVIPYEDDEITRLIIDTHDTSAFAAISALTVGSFRDWLLSDAATSEVLKKLSRGITPEMAAAVSKLMRNQDLILVAKKCEVTSAFRNTIGLRGRMSVRLQPNHPFDDAKGITASTSRPAKRAPTPSRARSIRYWSTAWSALSARNISTTARRSFAPGSRITSAASCSACRLASTFATPTTPKPTRTIWTIC